MSRAERERTNQPISVSPPRARLPQPQKLQPSLGRPTWRTCTRGSKTDDARLSLLSALPDCFARGNECAAAAKPITTSSEACPMCKIRTVAPLSICANHPLPLHTPAMFACRRLVGACRAHTVVVKMCASTCCWREDLCRVSPPPPFFLLLSNAATVQA